MQIIIDVLAGIGFLTVLGFVWVAFELLKEKDRKARGERNGRKSEQKRRGLSGSNIRRSLGEHAQGRKTARS